MKSINAHLVIYAATISWIALHHLIVWLEASLSDLVNSQRLLGKYL